MFEKSADPQVPPDSTESEPLGWGLDTSQSPGDFIALQLETPCLRSLQAGVAMPILQSRAFLSTSQGWNAADQPNGRGLTWQSGSCGVKFPLLLFQA